MNDKANKWLNSGEYDADIELLLTNIAKDVITSNSEATTASVFERHIYYMIKSKAGIDFIFEKEKFIEGISHRFKKTKGWKGNRGRLDAVVNDLVIEYKHHSALDNENEIRSAIGQVKNYLFALHERDGVEYNAILTDGIRICYFSFINGKIENTHLTLIKKNDIDTIIRAIISNKSKRFVPENILKDFAISSVVKTPAKDIAMTLYGVLKNCKTDKTRMLFSEWQSLMHLSLDDSGKSNDIDKRRKDLSMIFMDDIASPLAEYNALYALQTTYVIIVKLIAYRVMDKIDFNDFAKSYSDLSNISSTEMQVFFEKIEDGYSYRSNNINNFLEGDFFSWYSDSAQWNSDIWRNMINLIEIISQYSAFSFNIQYEPVDIFKDLYMSIIPKSVRHSMGEYFTPKWLASYVVDQGVALLDGQDWKAIDPCCGSGIFLIELIKKIVGNQNPRLMTRQQKKQIKEKILSSVYGIDINPLSVLSARVGYYLALRPFGELYSIDIPVYLGDSAIMANTISVDGVECYKCSIDNLKGSFNVILPKRYVEQPDFSNIMSELQACLRVEDPRLLFGMITERFSVEEKESANLKKYVQKMCSTLVLLHKEHWDGVWIRIITNFMLIARLKQFDLIIGNPPWVKWEHLPGAYAKKIKAVCDKKHIFSGAGQFGGTQLNICALIANVTATKWLSKDGYLVFLMPDSIVSQNSYEGFRNFYLDYKFKDRLFLQKIDRWMPPLRPFRSDSKIISQEFNTYYYSRRKVDYRQGIHVDNITLASSCSNVDLNRCQDFNNASKMLSISSNKAVQLSDKTTALSYSSNDYDFSEIIGETGYLYRTGVEFTPQQLYMFNGAGFSKNKGCYLFKNKPFTLSKYKIDDAPKRGWEFRTQYMFPIITGPHIEPFAYNTNNEFCILPYSKNETRFPISQDEFISNNRNAFIYLSNHRALIDAQSEKSKMMHRGKEFYALSKVGPYTFADHIVAVRDNSKFCASVINKTVTPWGEKKNTICVKHTIIISQRIDQEFIGEDEAYYICGVLNSEVVVKYIERSFKSNGFSLNKSNIYLPTFDRDNKTHQAICALSKRATLSKTGIESIKKQLSALYLDLCRNRTNQIR